VADSLKYALSAALNHPDDKIDLALAALLMAQYFCEPFEISDYLAQLDKIAEPLQQIVPFTPDHAVKIELLNSELFEGNGFKGNQNDYYHPDNSMLHKVLDTGQGIPITLSLIYIEVGRRLALPVWGIGIPRHFIVGYGDAADALYIDAFNGGQFLTEADCLRLSRVGTSHLASFKAKFLKPVTPRSILFRILLNLKLIFLSRRDYTRAYNALDLMLLIYPDQLNELKERGILAYRLGQLHDAVFDLRRYLFLAPDGDDSDWIERQVEEIESEILRIN
jgi:regulator of sirC expression with transglutaminase-like and TPR domain